MTQPPEFPGFPDFRANVTFVPLQFFTVVLPHRQRGCVRLVGFMIRRLLGWVDTEGNPTHEQVQFSYRALIREVGISRGGITEALNEALEHRLIRRVKGAASDDEAAYALCWSDRYTDSPDDFAGFFQREAVPLPTNGHAAPAPLAKAARKNIPNAFFDYVLRRERLSVVRVVGAMLFKSIQWGPGGERKTPVSLSITELSRLTKFSRHHVHDALHDALARGYVERTEEGRFDPRAGAESHAATYRIRWTAQAVNPVAACPNPSRDVETEPAAPFTFLDQSKKVNGETVQKSERGEFKKVNGNQSKKVNDISIKRSIKNKTTAAEAPPALAEPTASAAAAGGVMARLVEAGFDVPTAGHLVRAHAAEVILRQLDWLPLRRAQTSRLGLLRRAIEHDWPRPEGGGSQETVPAEHAAGSIFARHYEAAFHQLPEPPATCSVKEAAHATEFLRRLDVAVTEPSAAEWGKRFGEFVRTQAPAKPWLVWVLRVHGDAFVRHSRQASQRARQGAEAELRRAREEEFRPAYLAYLRKAEDQCRREQPALYAAFEAQRQEAADRFQLSDHTRALLATEASRLSAFADFMREQKQELAPFWEWDRRVNRQSRGRE